MLFKELLQVLIKLNYYNIRIDTCNVDTKTIKENIYKMNEIPSKYDNFEVLAIHTSDTYDSNLYQYYITIKI